MGRYNERSPSLRNGRLTYSCIRTLLVSDATERRSTDDQYFQSVIVIVLGFQVAIVNTSEKSPNFDQRTVVMKKIGAVSTCRIDCMRIREVQEVEEVVSIQ